MSKFEVSVSILGLLLAGLLGVGSIRSNWISKGSSVIIVPDQYLTIQEAINNAVERDTIFVRAGIYREHLTIDKSIALMGEDKYTTIVDGEGTGSVICAISDNVTFLCFTVRNSGRTVSGTIPDAGISLSHVNNCNITGNSLTDNYVGIFVRPSKTSWFTNNVITQNHIGIDINNQSTYNIISGNSLKENNVSIHIYYADSNVFSQNNSTDSPVGVIARYSSNNTLCKNEIANGDSGMILNGADFNNISTNIVSNLQYGIQLKAYADHNFISENSITNCSYAGINLDEYACDNILSNNSIVNSEVGIDVSDWSVNNTISRNHLSANLVSMHFWYADLNNISENSITSNYMGVVTLYSQSNRLYHNTFLNNTQQANVSGDYTNIWDEAHPSGGNYWSNYNGTDHFCGPHQNETGCDGIGDTPYVVDEDNIDYYPLMKPYGGQHDIGIVASMSKTVVAEAYNTIITINATIINYGMQTETFNFTFQNTTTIQEQTLTLASRSSTTLTFKWNSTGLPKGNYTITASATPVLDETDTADNIFTEGIFIGVPGDIAPQFGLVDMKDIGTVVKAFGSVPGHTRWNPNADINDDDLVDMRDIGIVVRHFGEVDP